MEVVERDGHPSCASHHCSGVQRRSVGTVLIRLHKAEDATDVVLRAQERLQTRAGACGVSRVLPLAVRKLTFQGRACGGGQKEGAACAPVCVA